MGHDGVAEGVREEVVGWILQELEFAGHTCTNITMKSDKQEWIVALKRGGGTTKHMHDIDRVAGAGISHEPQGRESSGQMARAAPEAQSEYGGDDRESDTTGRATRSLHSASTCTLWWPRTTAGVTSMASGRVTTLRV